MRTAIVEPQVAAELRRAVLRPDAAPGTPFPGIDLPDTVHVAAFDGDAVVGTCAVFPQALPGDPGAPGSWRLRAMAVDPTIQRGGIGSAVLQAAIDAIVERGGRLLWCEARTTARGFYERHGFVAVGAEFVSKDSGLPHSLMWRELSDGPVSS